MNGLTQDLIAIDANVFEHLLNRQKNTQKHIGALLQQLIEDEIRLLVDDKKRIRKEYSNRLNSYVQKEQAAEGNAERIVLRHWFALENQKIVSVDQDDPLMKAVQNIIHEKRGKAVTDRFYVYVAFKEGRILVTNDIKDIVNRRSQLRKITRKARPNGADIMTSKKAHSNL